MQAAEVNDGPGARLARPRRAGEALTLTLRLTLEPGGHGEDLDGFDTLLALLDGDVASARPSVDEVGSGLRIHPGSRTVYRGPAEIALTRLEYDLLLCLARHPDRVFTRPQLLDLVWGQLFTSPRSVDVHVRRLRAKVGAGVPLVTTVRGVGYRLGVGCSVEILPGPGRVWPNG
ncbi:Transcriptional regulatory protein, C terminal [Micromonospora haikouensis]|uniref:Transcriptional regulatory protein, C terminal n=1 Tax=Micromonospora haikouensis TaxID=686309 RepID=A0A1C4X8I4_9ACTN|nr:Transcriptional regulatory protein, C terminal [Micromonospora haikouensis]